MATVAASQGARQSRRFVAAARRLLTGHPMSAVQRCLCYSALPNTTRAPAAPLLPQRGVPAVKSTMCASTTATTATTATARGGSATEVAAGVASATTGVMGRTYGVTCSVASFFPVFISPALRGREAPFHEMGWFCCKPPTTTTTTTQRNSSFLMTAAGSAHAQTVFSHVLLTPISIRAPGASAAAIAHASAAVAASRGSTGAGITTTISTNSCSRNSSGVAGGDRGASAAVAAAAGGGGASWASPCKTGLLQQRRSFATAAATAAATTREEGSGGGSVRNRLLLTLSSPSEAIYVKTPVHSVTVPGSEGAMTLTNGHSQMVARLKAGEIIVRRETAAGGGGSEAATDRYFISDGFLLFSSPEDDSGCCTAEVLGIELVPVHLLDKEKAVAALQTLLQHGATAADEWTKARTMLGQPDSQTLTASVLVALRIIADTWVARKAAMRSDSFFLRQELLSSVIRVAS